MKAPSDERTITDCMLVAKNFKAVLEPSYMTQSQSEVDPGQVFKWQEVESLSIKRLKTTTVST